MLNRDSTHEGILKIISVMPHQSRARKVNKIKPVRAISDFVDLSMIYTLYR